MKAGAIAPVVKGFNHKGFLPFSPVDKFPVKNFISTAEKQPPGQISLKNQPLAWLTVLRVFRFSATMHHFQHEP